jgi:release factor glutamine methyltransferase
VTAVNVQQALQLARQHTRDDGETFTLEAQVLLADILGRSRSSLLTHPELELNPDQEQSYRTDLEQIAAGVPLAYLLGWKDFYGRRFEVTRETLIPRPETEQLVERALETLSGLSRPRIVDVGTGSGCIAITIACEWEQGSLLASDRSMAALSVAKRNASTHAVGGRIEWMQADLLRPVRARFDLVCANLPYIPSGRLPALAVSEYEPAGALDGGREGMDHTARLIHQLPGTLAPHGTALLEIDQDQGQPLAAIARECLPASDIDVEIDSAGLERLLIIRRGAA